jgi:hypothetical protein
MFSTNGEYKSVDGNALKYIVSKFCGSHNSGVGVQFPSESSSSRIFLRMLDSDHGTTTFL